MTGAGLRPAERDLLLHLLELPTAGPLEGDAEPRLWDAQRAYAEAARPLGFEVLHHAAADPAAAGQGRLETSEIRARAGLLWRGLTGRW